MRARFLRAIMVSAAFYPTAAVMAQDTTVPTGTINTERKDVGGDDQVLIEQGAALSVNDTAIRWNQTSSGLRIDNYGIIISVAGGGRAINAGGADGVERSIVLDNHEGAIIRSEHDAFRINRDTTVGTIAVRNAGTILSTVEGQAIDFDALAGTPEARAAISIVNEATGLIEAIGADGIRPGAGASIVNAGIIRSGGVAGDNNDGVDWQQHSGTIVNQSGGLITGQRHGITSDIFIDVVNEEGGVIVGRNGSGIGSDGDGRVVNYGRITGAYDGSGDGDGDGIDIDYYGIVDNYGIIEGTGAGGFGNEAEGVLVTAGGLITNHEGASITGVVRGVTTGLGTEVRNFGRIEATGTAPLPTPSDGIGGGDGATIYNAATGTISGNKRGIFADGGFAIENEGLIHGGEQGVFLLGQSTNSVTNSGTIQAAWAGLQAQGGNNTIINSGTIAGGTYAILLLGGSNTLELREGSVLVGAVDGGPGSNLLRLTEGVVFDSAVNFQQLEVTGDALVRGDSVFDSTSIATGATLSLGEGGTSGSVGGPIANDGVLRLDRSDELVLSAPISGTGALVQAGSGSTTLAGANSFAGPVAVSGGTLRLAGGAALQDAAMVSVGSGATLEVLDDEAIGTLAGEGAVLLTDSLLTLTQATGSFDGAISGTGGLDVRDAVFRLGGASSFSGDTMVSGGQLIVDGALSQSTVVLGQGGVLGGSGSVAGVSSTGGIIAPGNSIGQLSVAGNLTLSAADIYQVEVNASGASDLLAVGGQAVLNDAGVQVLAENGRYRGRTSYNILTANGGVSGTFGEVTSNFAFLDPSLEYDADGVTLVLTRNNVDFAGAATTGNERAVAVAVQALGAGNDLFEEALFLSDTAAPVVFGGLSGEIYAGVAAGLVENAHAIQRQLVSRPVSGAEGLYGWGDGLASWGHADETGRNARLETDQQVLLGGLGYRANGFEVALGAGVAEADVRSVGRADVTSTLAVATLGYEQGAFTARIGGTYAWHDGSTQRTARIGELGGDVRGDLDGTTRQVFARVGYAVPLGGLDVTPFAGINHVRVTMDDLVEEGGATALTLARDKRSVTYTNLGVALTPASDTATTGTGAGTGTGMSIQPFASAAWRHAGGDRGQAYEAALDGASFLATGPVLSGDAAELAGGVSLTSGALRVSAGYEGLLSNRWTQHSARLAATLAF